MCLAYCLRAFSKILLGGNGCLSVGTVLGINDSKMTTINRMEHAAHSPPIICKTIFTKSVLPSTPQCH